jgi:hypothetical protein
MKTTIDFPDELLHRAKVMAAEKRTTLREIMVQALEQATKGGSKEEEDKKRKTKFRLLLKKMKASNTEPMQPLNRDELHDC